MKNKIILGICILLLLSGCIEYKEKISDEWLDEHAEQLSDNEWRVYVKDNPCIVFPNLNHTITEEVIEECCDENSCRFESPQYELIGVRK